MAAVTLQDFVTLEDGIAALAKRRMVRLIAEHDDQLTRVGGSGDRQAVSAALAALPAPAWTEADEKRLRALSGIAARIGAGSISDDAADNWVKPNPARQTILDLAVTQYQSLERAYLTHEAAAAAERFMADYEALQVAKADLVPADFGYVPQAGTPPPWSGVRNAAVEGVLAPSQLAANLTTSRLVNYGGLDAMRVEVVQEYILKALLDARTSKICRSMNGRKFRVEDGMDLLERAFRVQNPADLKNVHPWVPAGMIADLPLMSNDSLRAKGFYVPPFHPRCRTVVVPSRRSVSTTSLGDILNPAAGLEDAVEDVLDDALISALAVPGVLLAGGAVAAAPTATAALVSAITQGASFALSAPGTFIEKLVDWVGALWRRLFYPKQLQPILHEIVGSPLEQRRFAAANTILMRQYETGVENAMFLDRKGRVKWYNDGKNANRTAAKMPSVWQEGWHEVIHSHPSPMTLSGADLGYASNMSIQRGRHVAVSAYTTDGGYYKATLYMDYNMMRTLHKELLKETFWKLAADEYKKSLTVEETQLLMQHIPLTVMARLGGLKYQYKVGTALREAYSHPGKLAAIKRTEDYLVAKYRPIVGGNLDRVKADLAEQYAKASAARIAAKKSDDAGYWLIDANDFTSEDFKAWEEAATKIEDDAERAQVLASLADSKALYAEANDFILADLKAQKRS